MTVKRIITIAAALSLAVSCLTQIEDSLEVDWTSDTIAASGGTLVLSVNSTGEWDYVAENALWCEITRMDDVLIIKAGENKADMRTAAITVTSGSLIRSFTFSQKDRLADYSTPGLYNVKEMSFVLGDEGGTQTSLVWYSDGKMSARFIRPDKMDVLEVSGLRSGITAGEEVYVNVKAWSEGMEDFDERYSFKASIVEDTMVKFRDTANPESYLVLDLGEE